MPHGFAVVVTAPAAFRFTEPAAPERHRAVAELLTGQPVARTITMPCRARSSSSCATRARPAACGELGYGEADIPALVDGTLKQQRLLVCSPCEVTAADLEAILRASL